MATTTPPQRRGIFYGWYIIGMCMVGGFLGAGTSQLFMAVMLKPMTDEMGWSRTEMAGAVTAGTLAAGFLSPGMGRLVDRFGGRVLMPAGALIVTGAYLALGSLTELWQFYVCYIVGRAVATVTLGGVVPMAAAANWFRRMRGRALGMVQMSLPLGGSALVFVGQLIMGVADWRTVFFVFAALMFVGVALPAGVIMRRRPEDMGLLPDGDSAPSEEAPGVAPKGSTAPEFSWTLHEAMRTPALWLIIASAVLAILGNGAISFHQVAYFTDVGVPAAAAALALSAYGLAGAFSSGIWGFITERISERVCGVAAMLMAAASIVLLLVVRDLPTALVFSVMFGIAARGEGALISMILAQYYGRESYGSINGFVMPFQMVSLGLGPTVAAAAHEFTGSYLLLFAVFLGLYLVAAGLLYLAQRPALPPRAFQSEQAPVLGHRP